MSLGIPDGAWLAIAILIGTEYFIRQWVDGADGDIWGTSFGYLVFRIVSTAITAVLLAIALAPRGRACLLALSVTLIFTLEMPLLKVSGFLSKQTGLSFRWLWLLVPAAACIVSTNLFEVLSLGPVESGQYIIESLPDFTGRPVEIYVAGYTLLGAPMNYIIRCLLPQLSTPEYRLFGPQLPADGDGVNAVAATTEEDATGMTAGRVIGILERWLIVTLVLASQFSLIGLVLSAKSIARFSEIQKSRRFAEYYLMGTLYSTLSAVAVGLILRAG